MLEEAFRDLICKEFQEVDSAIISVSFKMFLLVRREEKT